MELSFLGASAEVWTLQARTTVESGIHCAKSSTVSALCSSCVNTTPCSGVLAGFCLRGSHSVIARSAHRHFLLLKGLEADLSAFNSHP